ncbi:MAG: hypothetical protein ACRDBM_12600, partial [Sporomusa sp.]
MNFDKFLEPLPLSAAFVPEKSRPGESYYKLPAEFGVGEVRKIEFNEMYMVLIGDYIPKDDLERILNLQEQYIDICQLETNSSSWKIGGQKLKPAEVGICCYVNTGKAVNIVCEAG